MAPPGILYFFENMDNNNNKNSCHHSPSSLLLSPFPSVSNCIKSPLHSDHDYVIKNNIDNIIVEPPCMMSLEDAFGCPPMDDNREVMTPSPPSNHGDSEVNADVFDGFSLVKQQGLPQSNDADFLQGLDELDFDFDDLDTGRDDSLENDFQDFMDATLDERMDIAFIDSSNCDDNMVDENGEDGEDIYKKEFFLKHLGLQRVSPDTHAPQQRSRKRKFVEDTDQSPCAPQSSTVLVPSRSYHSRIPETFNDPSSSVQNLHIVSHNPNNTQHTSPPHSVPSKLCSCAASDSQRTVLYSTAKSSNVASVQTSPSTASRLLCHRRENSSPKNDTDFLLSSPSDIFLEEIRDNFDFQFLDKGDVDEDTEDLLQWLDNEDVKTTMCQSSSQIQPQNGSLAASERDTSVAAPGYLESVLSLENQPSSGDQMMETFIDLESYVTEESSSIKDSVPFNSVVGHVTTNNDHNNNMANAKVFSKSQLRLTILSDISNELLNNSEYTERKDAIKRDILRSCRSPHVTAEEYSNFQSDPSDYSSFSSSSPPYSSKYFSGSSSESSSPSSSTLSSPTSPSFTRQKNSKSLDILNLFSDENSPMLLGGSDVSISSVRFM